MAKHRIAPHVLVRHPYITTQYGPICTRCPKPAISRWHLVRGVTDHRRRDTPMMDDSAAGSA